jgi:hypothetical protein
MELPGNLQGVFFKICTGFWILYMMAEKCYQADIFLLFWTNGTTTNTPKFSCIAHPRFCNSAISQFTPSVLLYFTWITGYIVNMFGS